MNPELQVAGLVLCRVGPARLAFLATEVTALDSARGRQTEPRSGRPKVLIAPTGEAVWVDSLEIQPDTFALLPTPSLLAGGAGGALRGFVSLGTQLWPVLDLQAYARFVHQKGEA
ncbi:MAG: protein CrdC [Myxococcota bacterium]